MIDISKLAALARIKLSKEEEKSLSKEFDSILGYVDQIRTLKLKGEAKTDDKEDLINLLREDDENYPSDQNSEKLLSLSPDRDGRYIKVKKIL